MQGGNPVAEIKKCLAVLKKDLYYISRWLLSHIIPLSEGSCRFVFEGLMLFNQEFIPKEVEK